MSGSGWKVFASISSKCGSPQGYIFGPTLFLLHINDLPDSVICDIAIYADDTTLYSILLSTSLFSILNLNLIYETLWTGVRSGLLISMLGKLSWFCLTCLITIAFSSKLDWGSYIISIGKTAFKKIGALIHSVKFLSAEVALSPLLGIITQTTKTNMQDCWSFTCCFSGIFGPSLKYGQLKSYSIGITLVDVLQN